MKHSPLLLASAGATAAAISTIVMYPVDTVKTRLSLCDSSTSALDVIINTWKKGGVNLFYRGLRKKIYFTVLQKFLYFFFYAYLRGKFSSSLVLGYFSALLSSFLVTPLEVLQTREQLESPPPSLTVTSLYRGFGANILLCLNPAIESAVFERLRAKLKTPKASEIFFLGVTAKSAATVLTYPLIRAKTLEQGGDRSLISILADKKEMFKGLETQLGKVVLTSALMHVIKDKIENLLRSAIHPESYRPNKH